MRRAARTLTVLATLAWGGLAALPAAAVAAPNPSENLPLQALPAECSLAPLAEPCENALIQELDRARMAIGLGPYLLPTGFATFPPDRQLLILADLDRAAYGLPLVPGLNAELTASAAEAARGDYDPQPPGELSQGGSLKGFASNWAGGFVNVLAAYYEWMYDDGYPSANRECPSAGAPGCWGHRENVLETFPVESEGSLSLGAAAGTDEAGQPSYTLLLAFTSQAGAYYYTWAEAQAAGAGVEPLQPSAPEAPPEIVATTLGTPTVGDGLAAGCLMRCASLIAAEEAAGPAGAGAGGGEGVHVAASLAGQLVPPPRAALLPVLLRTGACPLHFKSPSAGFVSIRWYGTPRRARAGAAGRARPVLLAAGGARFQSPSVRTVKVRLTALGLRILRRHRHLTLTALGTFTPAGSRPVSAKRSFTLAR
jgi:hypothetical protein